jgi:DNA-binding NarL/FixJ family response regulator
MPDIHEVGPMPVTVLLADDSEVMRQAIRQFLIKRPEIELVGEAADFDQAIQLMSDLAPQVTVIDLHMPHSCGQELKRKLCNGVSTLIAVSAWNDEESRILAKSYGAVQLLDKMSLYTELVPAIMQIAFPSGCSDPE